MKTNKEKELTIALLTEKIERITGKKVKLLKEDDYWEPQPRGEKTKREKEEELQSFIETLLDPESDNCNVVHGGEDIMIGSKKWKNKEGEWKTPTMPEEDWKEFGNYIILELRKEFGIDYGINFVSKSGFSLSKEAIKESKQSNRTVLTEVDNRVKDAIDVLTSAKTSLDEASTELEMGLTHHFVALWKNDIDDIVAKIDAASESVVKFSQKIRSQLRQ